ncbi:MULTISPECIES: hypothetical protein [unclassified Acidovorax]|uniref:hypothetical protein n=1 Tax=unclassified Acidovorax TaxID=2684926 RepID=UPI0018EEA895|nr:MULTISPECIES: hypothetical protein [unclassified Acidovorax]MDH4418294.1 hypothetical protein [Acidovorax sp.]
MHRPLRRTEAYRWAVGRGMLVCALAWGLVELLALQRSRFQQWRQRQQAAIHHH